MLKLYFNGKWYEEYSIYFFYSANIYNKKLKGALY